MCKNTTKEIVDLSRSYVLRYTTTGKTLPTRYTFTGQYSYVSDDATDLGAAGFGLMFYNARWYDPAIGRFAQADSIVPGGVQGLDRYAYGLNNPSMYTDPTGRDPFWCVNERNPAQFRQCIGHQIHNIAYGEICPMKTKYQTILIFCLAGMLILVLGYKPSFLALTSPSSATSECILPYTNLAFPEGVGEIEKQQETQIPPTNWQYTTDVSKPSEGLSIFAFTVSGNEVWISYQANKKDQKKLLSRYDLKKNAWEYYDVPENFASLPSTLFLSKVTGELWGYFLFYSDVYPPSFSPAQNQKDGIPLLMRYNSSKDRFDPIMDKDGILQTPKVIYGNIVEDEDGLFWMFSKERPSDESLTLYSFDPMTLQAQKYDLHVNSFPVLYSGNGGKLWMTDWSRYSLILYNTRTQKTQYIDSIRTIRSVDTLIPFKEVINQDSSPLYFDSSGRLWFGYSGWLDLNNPEDINWYKVIVPPEFVVYAESIAPFYMMAPPSYESIYQSSNGWVWFSTIDGVIRLKIGNNFRNGEWCKVTNGRSKVIEDQQGNLWMVVFNKIYKYKLP